MCKIRVGIARGDDLTLFGHAEAAVDAASRLRTNGIVGWPATARDRPAAAVEDGQTHLMLLSNTRDLLLCLIQRPVGHQITAVLVAVGVTDHHHLFVVTS